MKKNSKHLHTSKKEHLYYMIVFLIISFLTSWFALSEYHENRSINEAQLSNYYTEFYRKLDAEVGKHIMLVESVTAYVESSETLDNRMLDGFIERLLKDNSELVKNIRVLADTTVVYDYSGNERLTDTNLLEVVEERDLVLEVKENLDIVSLGPADMIEAGNGYIIGMPIIENNVYWGQVNLILDEANVAAFIRGVAKEEHLTTWIDSDEGVLDNSITNKIRLESIRYSDNLEILNWDVWVGPEEGWNQVKYLKILYIILMGIVTIVIFVFMIRLFAAKMERIKIENIDLQKSAYLDTMTNVYNRDFFYKECGTLFSEADQRHDSISVIFFDIDYFKSINDQYGHDVGDQVLKSVTTLIKSSLRREDLLIRWGGEEFLIILRKTDLKNAMRIAKKLKGQLNQGKFIIDLKVTASFGVAVKMENELLSSLIERSDLAMYQAKKEGRNKVMASVSNKELKPYQKHIVWKETWNSGNHIIDLQHKNLLLDIDVLMDKIYFEEYEEIELIFDRIEADIVEHFETEEQILYQHGYGELEEHSHIHKGIIKNLHRIKMEIMSRTMSLEDLYKTIIEHYIINHMLFEDVKFYRLLKGKSENHDLKDTKNGIG